MGKTTRDPYSQKEHIEVRKNLKFGVDWSNIEQDTAIYISLIILLHEKFVQFDWLRAVVFQLNLKYLHVKITTLLWVVV